MNIDEMPALPRVEALPKEPLARVILTFLVAELSRHGSVTISQRQIAGKFNRSSHPRIGKHLKVLVDSGFIEVDVKSAGVVPNSYKRGAFFDRRTRDNERLFSLSKRLFGPKGLLSDWKEDSAWGHGALGPIGVLCVATLSRLDGPTAQPALKKYLDPLCPGSSVDTKLRKLRLCGLIVKSPDGVALVADWESVLHGVLAANPAGHLRKERGDRRRKEESEANFHEVNRGCLSHEDRRQMKFLPCVFCGNVCGDLLEHFPPNRFLGDVKERNHRALLYAICLSCNQSEAAFIKAMDECVPERLARVSLKGMRDPLAAFVVYANERRQIFYEAVKLRDHRAAARVVCEVLAFWNALETMGLTGYVDRKSILIDGDWRPAGGVIPVVCASQLPLGVSKRYEAKVPRRRRGHILVERVLIVEPVAHLIWQHSRNSRQLRYGAIFARAAAVKDHSASRLSVAKVSDCRFGRYSESLRGLNDPAEVARSGGFKLLKMEREVTRWRLMALAQE